MWHGVSPVDGDHDPIAYEGKQPAQLLFLNAGPAEVQVRAWREPAPERNTAPAESVSLRAGGQTCVQGSLIRIHLAGAGHSPPSPTAPMHAAVAWRLVDGHR
jgi:hypothetical protein